MGGIIRFIKNSFGLQKRGYEYWTYANNIKIPFKYDTDLIGLQKMHTYEKRRELLTKKYQTLLENNDFEDNGLE